MARKKNLPAQTYTHTKATRKNNPPARLAAEGHVKPMPRAEYGYSPRLPPQLRFDATGQADRLPELLAEATRRPLTPDEARLLADALRRHEPWLEWAGKRERPAFAVDPVAVHIHERVSAQAILATAARKDVERSLFADPSRSTATPCASTSTTSIGPTASSSATACWSCPRWPAAKTSPARCR